MATRAVPADGVTAAQAPSAVRDQFRQRARAQATPDKTVARERKAAAVQLVESGNAASALARVRTFPMRAANAAAKLAERRAVIRDQVSRGDLTASGAMRQSAEVMQQHRDGVSQVVKDALVAIDEVRAAFPPTPPLGSTLILPPERKDLPAYLQAATTASPAQVAQMIGEAAVASDRLLANALAWTARGQLATRWLRDPQRIVAEQAIADGAAQLAEPRELAGHYAAAVADRLESALQVLGTALERDGMVDPAYAAAQAWAPFDAPAPDASLADLFDATVGLDQLPALLKLAPDGGLEPA